MSVASILLRGLRASPFSLTFILGKVISVGYGCAVCSVGGPIDSDMEVISEDEAEALL